MPEQTDARYCVLVNGHAVEPGCWVDGHWGQYGPDHLADRAEELGWKPATADDDPRTLRVVADEIQNAQHARGVMEPVDAATGHEVHYTHRRDRWVYRLRFPIIQLVVHVDTIDGQQPTPTWPASNVWEQRSEATDAIERWLNNHTETDGYTWGWHDGEFYLWPDDTWEEVEG